MKKIAALSFLFVFLTGCFGGDVTDDQVQVAAGWQRQEFSTFVVQVPPGWNRVDKSKLSTSIPAGTVVVYATELESGFIKNMNVVKETLNTDATPKEYARANITLAKQTLPQYNVVSEEEVDIYGQKTLLHVFQARNAVTDNLIYFTQGYFAKDKTGYTVTCVMPDGASKDNMDMCRKVVLSFELK